MIVIEDEGKVKVKELMEVNEPEVIKASKEKRPEVLNSKTYKLKSAFVDYAIYITLSYVEDEKGRKRPFEIFINSKDLTKAAEYAVLTRLISAIFRRSEDPTFIIEELKSIYDPNGGYFKDGKYIPSIYAEIADVLEMFFIDIGLIKKKKSPKLQKIITLGSYTSKEASSISKVGESSSEESSTDKESNQTFSSESLSGNASLKICPKCSSKSLKLESGCYVCINPECNYSKCS